MNFAMQRWLDERPMARLPSSVTTPGESSQLQPLQGSTKEDLDNRASIMSRAIVKRLEKDYVEIIQRLPSATTMTVGKTVGTTCAWPHCCHFNKRFAPDMRRVSIEPKKNLTLDIIPYEPIAILSVVRASTRGEDNLRGRGRKNVLWMHLECNEQCIAYLNNAEPHSNPARNHTLASFAHSVHHEERCYVTAANNYQLDERSTSVIRQWKMDQDGRDLSFLFGLSDSLEKMKGEGEPIKQRAAIAASVDGQAPQTRAACDQKPDLLAQLEENMDTKGDILDIDETFGILMEHIVPVHDEDRARYMLTNRLRSLIYSSWQDLV